MENTLAGFVKISAIFLDLAMTRFVKINGCISLLFGGWVVKNPLRLSPFDFAQGRLFTKGRKLYSRTNVPGCQELFGKSYS
jgi:hypothetical protein